MKTKNILSYNAAVQTLLVFALCDVIEGVLRIQHTPHALWPWFYTASLAVLTVLAGKTYLAIRSR